MEYGLKFRIFILKEKLIMISMEIENLMNLRNAKNRFPALVDKAGNP